MASLKENIPLSTTHRLSIIHPSRALTDLLRSPQTNTPEHLLAVSLAALDDLNKTHTNTNIIHTTDRTHYSNTRCKLNESIAAQNMWVDVPLRVSMAMREVKECDRAERALEASKKQMEKCEKECKILRKDIGYLTTLLQERQNTGVKEESSEEMDETI